MEAPRPRKARGVTRRRLVSRIALSGAVTALLGLVGVAAHAAVPLRVRVTRRSVTPSGWPAGRRLRVAVLSDLHANARHVGTRDIEDLVARTNALSPDVTVLLGDYGSQDPGALAPEAVAALLAGLSAPLGVHAVQGNHDWLDDRAALRAGRGPTRVEAAFRATGISFLGNAAVPLGGGVWLAGIESEEARPGPRRGPGLDRHRLALLDGMLSDVPAGDAAILLAHEPDIFAALTDGRIGLTLSGHTHGGQVRILGWSPWIPSRYGLRYAYGHVEEAGRHLVVSGGIGSHFVAGRPLRIGMPPEIVIVEVGGEGA